MTKSLQELDVLSNFLINAIANDPDVSEPFFRLLLSILLEIEIGRITVRAQSVIPGDTPNHRGIRLDVEIMEHLEGNEKSANCRIFNVEPQLYPDNLPKRNRFYQAKKDSKQLKSGERNWDMLPDLLMIVITNFDPFGEDSMVYTFENVCKEFPDLEYRDGLKFIYFNTTGKLNIQNAKKELLTYLNSSKINNVTNDDIAQIHQYVNHVKQSAEVENRYMTLGELIDYGRAEARAEALAEGRMEGRAEGRMESLLDILNDLGPISEEFQARLQHIDEDTLKKWVKLAAKAESIDGFLESI